MTDRSKTEDQAVSSPLSNREIVITRFFDAPRERVWEAWTNPERVGHWWGPEGFTTTTYEMDVRPGGVWKFVMHGPDGTNYDNLIAYREVVKPERLVYSHGEDEEADGFEVTVTFELTANNKTQVTLRQLYKTAAEREFAVKEIGAIEGGKQTLDQLAEYLKTM